MYEGLESSNLRCFAVYYSLVWHVLSVGIIKMLVLQRLGDEPSKHSNIKYSV